MASDHPADRAKSAKLLSMFHCALGGTIFIYQGQEIGTCNVPREWSEEEYKDVETIQHIQGERDHRRKMTSGKNPDVSDLLKGMRETARDNARTPIQVRRLHAIRCRIEADLQSGIRQRMPDSQKGHPGCESTMTMLKDGTWLRRSTTQIPCGRSGSTCSSCANSTKL